MPRNVKSFLDESSFKFEYNFCLWEINDMLVSIAMQ